MHATFHAPLAHSLAKRSYAGDCGCGGGCGCGSEASYGGWFDGWPDWYWRSKIYSACPEYALQVDEYEKARLAYFALSRSRRNSAEGKKLERAGKEAERKGKAAKKRCKGGASGAPGTSPAQMQQQQIEQASLDVGTAAGGGNMLLYAGAGVALLALIGVAAVVRRRRAAAAAAGK